MNQGTFIASETVEHDGDALRYAGGEPASMPVYRQLVPKEALFHVFPPHSEDKSPAAQDARLKSCGLVQYDDQLSSKRFIAPAGKRFDSRVQVLPLYMVKPKPGMEIEAIDGEKYVLPADFKGDWFEVTSPKGVRLIA